MIFEGVKSNISEKTQNEHRNRATKKAIPFAQGSLSFYNLIKSTTVPVRASAKNSNCSNSPSRTREIPPR